MTPLYGYMQNIKIEFARMGFIGCPLTDEEIKACFDNGLTQDQAYGIGCDALCCEETHDETMESIQLAAAIDDAEGY